MMKYIHRHPFLLFCILFSLLSAVTNARPGYREPTEASTRSSGGRIGMAIDLDHASLPSTDPPSVDAKVTTGMSLLSSDDESNSSNGDDDGSDADDDDDDDAGDNANDSQCEPDMSVADHHTVIMARLDEIHAMLRSMQQQAQAQVQLPSSTAAAAAAAAAATMTASQQKSNRLVNATDTWSHARKQYNQTHLAAHDVRTSSPGAYLAHSTNGSASDLFPIMKPVSTLSTTSSVASPSSGKTN